MRVGLFNLHTGGHHVERGVKLLRELDRRAEDLTVDYVVPERTPSHDRFPDDTLVTLPNFDYEGDDEESVAYRREAVRAAFDYFDGSEYDLVHLIELDDVLEPVDHYASSCSALPPLLGRLDGGRFFRNTRRYRATTALAHHPTGGDGYQWLQRRLFGDEATSAETRDWLYRLAGPLLQRAPVDTESDRDAFDQLIYSLIKPATLRNSMDRGVYDHLFVQTEPAKEYLRALSPTYADRHVSVVPDPVDDWFDDLPPAAEARAELDIDETGTVLLTFGELRDEKGIDVLLDALERYDGQEFTTVIVGRPVDVSEEEVRAAKSRTDVRIHEVLEFIPEEHIPLYFAAADGVVVPYRPSFGAQRTSGPFQKAAASGLPVVAPAFGMFERRVSEWDMGLTFEPDSPADLARALRRFVPNPASTYDLESTRAYARSQSYEALTDDVLAQYRRMVEAVAASPTVDPQATD